MEERDSIILAYRREGLSIREIARRNGMSRKTVRKYLRAFEQAVGDNPDAEAMDTYLQQPVRYDSSRRVRRVMNQQVMEAIDGFMARNRSNAAAGLRKQRMRKIDMWRRLRDQGIEIAYSTVCQYVRALEVAVPAPAKSPAAFIRQEYEPGFRCEFDWGVLTLWIAGVKTRLHMAVFTMSHSNLRRAYLFSREDTLALMEAHRNCFRALGGTPQVMAYDNMRVAVK
ncbi:helix-turn-helix domain-containing protein, partial [Bacteroides clarus]